MPVEETLACLDRLGATETKTRKRVLRAVRNVAAERPRAIEGYTGPLSAFLTATNMITGFLFEPFGLDVGTRLETESLSAGNWDTERFYEDYSPRSGA